MNAFAAATAALLADPNMGVVATYRPLTGPSRSLRAIRSRPREVGFGAGGMGAVLGPETAMIAAADVDAPPRRGDEIEFSPTDKYKVERAERDDVGAVWTLTLAGSDLSPGGF
jgi:hypothetical protein